MDRREALKTAAGLASMAILPTVTDAGTSHCVYCTPHPAEKSYIHTKRVDSTPESRYKGAILQKLDDFFIANHKLFYEGGADSLMAPVLEIVATHPEEPGLDYNKCKEYCLELALSYLADCRQEYERNAHLMTYVKSS